MMGSLNPGRGLAGPCQSKSAAAAAAVSAAGKARRVG